MRLPFRSIVLSSLALLAFPLALPELRAETSLRHQTIMVDPDRAQAPGTRPRAKPQIITGQTTPSPAQPPGTDTPPAAAPSATPAPDATAPAPATAPSPATPPTATPPVAEPNPATVKDPKEVGTEATPRKTARRQAATRHAARRRVACHEGTGIVFRSRLGPDPVVPAPGPINRADPCYRPSYKPFNSTRIVPNLVIPQPPRPDIAPAAIRRLDPPPPPVVPKAEMWQAPSGLLWKAPPTGVDVAPPSQDVSKLCTDQRTLAEIVQRFNWVQSETWGTAVRMVGISGIREVALKNDGIEREKYTYVPKRYCRAEAVLNTGRRHKLAYLLNEEGGFVGLYAGLTFCVAGYDWFNQNEPSCRVLNPY
jgi:hypothetical protein